MDMRTADFLRQVNNNFYASCAQSFSATRTSAWAGWRRCARHIANVPNAEKGVRVLDIACGNMRFESFLRTELQRIPFKFSAVDDCHELAASRFCTDGVNDSPDYCSNEALAHSSIQFQNLDILGSLFAGNLATDVRDACNNVVACFGFMHHVPGFDARCNMMRALIDLAASDALIFVSLWRFMNDDRLAAKASDSWCGEDPGFNLQLEHGDYFLGWQNQPGLIRYCHHFDDHEVQRLTDVAEHAGARVIEVFDADGKSGALNRYLVLQKF